MGADVSGREQWSLDICHIAMLFCFGANSLRPTEYAIAAARMRLGSVLCSIDSSRSIVNDLSHNFITNIPTTSLIFRRAAPGA